MKEHNDNTVFLQTLYLVREGADRLQSGTFAKADNALPHKWNKISIE
jgi:hypothetical protein